MIVRFSVENWMSFKETAVFSMIASSERQHSERVPKIHKYPTRILPIAAIYGGNASGKTNFFDALFFLQNLIVRGTHPGSKISVKPFSLDKTSKKLPSVFAIEILIDDTIYDFSFKLNKHEISEEKLIIINSRSEKTLYERKNKDITLERSLDKQEIFHFAFSGTRDNQLFLTNTVNQNIDEFKPIYNWFKNNLELISPNSRYLQIENILDESHSLNSAMNNILSLLDTGISHLGGEEIPFDNLQLPNEIKQELLENLDENESVLINTINDRYVITCEHDELTAKNMVAYHSKPDGSEVKFKIGEESSGTQRVIDLLPAFLDLIEESSTKTYIIDELDRSLHTLLTRELIKIYLSQCSTDSRAQLIFTTHDTQLMDQSLFRRDEMWVTERNLGGETDLTTFIEYKDIRYDKDIRKSYLAGRLGGIPKVASPTAYTSYKEVK